MHDYEKDTVLLLRTLYYLRREIPELPQDPYLMYERNINSLLGLLDELYNLKDDSGETKDIAKLHPDIIERADYIFKNSRTDALGFPYGGVKQNHRSMDVFEY